MSIFSNAKQVTEQLKMYLDIIRNSKQFIKKPIFM